MPNPEHLFTREAQLVFRARSGPLDAFGTPTLVETLRATVCEVQPTKVAESHGPGGSRVDFRGYFRVEDADLADVDAVILASGVELELIGPPRPRVNPRTGAVDFIEVDLAVTA